MATVTSTLNKMAKIDRVALYNTKDHATRKRVLSYIRKHKDTVLTEDKIVRDTKQSRKVVRSTLVFLKNRNAVRELPRVAVKLKGKKVEKYSTVWVADDYYYVGKYVKMVKERYETSVDKEEQLNLSY